MKTLPRLPTNDYIILRGCVCGTISSYGLAWRSSSEEYDFRAPAVADVPYLGSPSAHCRPPPGRGPEMSIMFPRRASFSFCLRRTVRQMATRPVMMSATPTPAPIPALAAMERPEGPMISPLSPLASPVCAAPPLDWLVEEVAFEASESASNDIMFGAYTS